MPATLSSMAKARQSEGGEAKRSPVQIPAVWRSVINKIIAKTKQTPLHLILDLVAEKADELGIDHPKLPWEIAEND